MAARRRTTPGQTYAVHDGQIRSGLVVVAYNLRDVNPGDGGFAGVAGSHKANFALPDDWKELEVEPPRPFVTPVTGPAGTAIVFTEAMSHGTLPWRGAGERRTVFSSTTRIRSHGPPASTTATATPV